MYLISLIEMLRWFVIWGCRQAGGSWSGQSWRCVVRSYVTWNL